MILIFTVTKGQGEIKEKQDLPLAPAKKIQTNKSSTKPIKQKTQQSNQTISKQRRTHRKKQTNKNHSKKIIKEHNKKKRSKLLTGLWNTAFITTSQNSNFYSKNIKQSLPFIDYQV